MLRLPPVDDLVPSPDNQWLLFSDRDEVYVSAMPPANLATAPEVSNTDGSVPVWRLTDAAGGYAAWADGGKAVTWTLGAEFHRLTLADAIAFEEAQKAKEAKRPSRGQGAKDKEAQGGQGRKGGEG